MASKRIQKYRSEDLERDFWSEADSVGDVDWTGARPLVLPELKLLANKRDIPNQSLLKLLLAEKLDEELRKQDSGDVLGIRWQDPGLRPGRSQDLRHPLLH